VPLVPPKPFTPSRTKRRHARWAALTSITITGAVATALYLGGTHAAPPASPTVTAGDGGLQTGMVAQMFTWKVTDPTATGVRLWIDGQVTAVMPVTTTATTYALTCGVKHRFNYQPYNNAGIAPLKALPVYVTPSCTGATR
jgi:hypothetical protein